MGSALVFNLKGTDAEALYHMIGQAQGSQLHADKGTPFAVYELRTTLGEHCQAPDEDWPLGSAVRAKYCSANDLTASYFPKTVVWEFRRGLLDILKLILKSIAEVQTGATMEAFIELCDAVRLRRWFDKNFKRTISIDLEDDCDLDDEIEDDAEDEEKDNDD